MCFLSFFFFAASFPWLSLIHRLFYLDQMKLKSAFLFPTWFCLPTLISRFVSSLLMSVCKVTVIFNEVLTSFFPISFNNVSFWPTSWLLYCTCFDWWSFISFRWLIFCIYKLVAFALKIFCILACPTCHFSFRFGANYFFWWFQLLLSSS